MTETNTTAADPKSELAAMTAVAKALEGLDPAVAERVLRWAAESHGIKRTRTEPERAAGSDNNGAARQFESFAEFHAAASPESEVDRALVAGYWKQFVEGAPEFAAQQINSALKDQGGPINNITGAFDSLKSKKPALVVQLKKAGSTRQARKSYKLTAAGKQAVELMISQH